MATIVKPGQVWRLKSGNRKDHKIIRVVPGYSYWDDNGRERGFGPLKADGTPDGWEQDWEIVAPENIKATPKAEIKVGCYCELCKDYAAYASPNRPDGKTFICYSCRSGWIPIGL
jgi:hypothetical protein